MIGVDEHVWRHTRRGDEYVTVIIHLTPVRDGTGPARLLAMTEGLPAPVIKQWLADQDASWRVRVEVAAMDRFSGFKAAVGEELPDAVTVMDRFHVVRLAAEALDQCRRRVQQRTHGHRGRTGDLLYSAKRTLRTCSGLPAERRRGRLVTLFANEDHVEVEAIWGIYQRMIAAYRQPARGAGRAAMTDPIAAVSVAAR